MSEILEIVKNPSLTHEQKVIALAKAAENTTSPLNYPANYNYYRANDSICDLFEGNAPYCPRYILPDYSKLLLQGCRFLDMEPPSDFDELLNSLMILYRHVPSVTTFPVYIGALDELVAPFIGLLSDDEILKKLSLFLRYIDRTITDSFCHANIGPADSRAARLILRAVRAHGAAVPNLTLLVGKETTDELIEEAAICTLECANPAFADFEKYEYDMPGFGIASCYNALLVGGGAYTLARLKLAGLSKLAESREHFMNELLPDVLTTLADYMAERVRFICCESGFFQNNFLSKEGFIDKSKFTGMFGIVGLAECANTIMALEGKTCRYGHGGEADDFAEEVVSKISKFAAEYDVPHLKAFGGHFLMHAQVGIEKDVGSTAGCRIPIGEEPKELFEHLLHSARFHPYFIAGIGDIFPMEPTAKSNPAFVADIVRGAFKTGLRYLSFYSSDSDIVRISGYLVKRSEVEKLRDGKAVLHDTTALGMGAIDNMGVLNRRVRG